MFDNKLPVDTEITHISQMRWPDGGTLRRWNSVTEEHISRVTLSKRAYWKRSTQHAESVHPDISKFEVFFWYNLHTNYLYECPTCGYNIGSKLP